MLMLVRLRRPALARVCAAVALASVLVPVGVARGEDAAIARGHAFAEASCARCHAVGTTGASPFAAAPPFRDLHRRYPVEGLAESLAEGIVTGHSGMPEFELEPDQIEDFIDYLKSLETPPAPVGK